MATLRQPLLSAAASGKLGKALQFSLRKGRAIAGRRRRPAQPRTEPQVATRRWMTFLSSLWGDLSIAEKASWADFQTAKPLPNYNKFLSFNTTSYKPLHGYPTPPDIDWYMPAAWWPPSRTVPPATRGSLTNVAGPGYATFSMPITWVGDGWVILFHHVDPANNTPTYTNFIGGLIIAGVSVHEITFRNLPAGLYKVACIIAGRSGKARTPWAFSNAYPT